MNSCGGSHRSICVSHRKGIPLTRNAYLSMAPCFIRMGCRVSIRKRIHGGVIFSRFSAREKKWKTSDKELGSQTSRRSVWTRMARLFPLRLEARGGNSAQHSTEHNFVDWTQKIPI